MRRESTGGTGVPPVWALIYVPNGVIRFSLPLIFSGRGQDV